MELRRIGFLGPVGTFTHQAALSDSSLSGCDLVPFPTIRDVLRAVSQGDIEAGVVPLENAIEGTVSETMDALIFDNELFIERELVISIELHLMASVGATLSSIKEVWSYPHALAQCRTYLSSLPGITTHIAASTADAARLVAEASSSAAAVAPAVAASIYGLEIIATNIADHEGNATKFVVVGRSRVPAASGHDRTTIVCFQDADRPGSLYGILGRFAARDINLTRLESRPTKRGLGDYCFVIELEGHVSDDIVGDCLVDLQAHHTRVKFLGSYPVFGERADALREDVRNMRHDAQQWLRSLVERIEGSDH